MEDIRTRWNEGMAGISPKSKDYVTRAIDVIRTSPYVEDVKVDGDVVSVKYVFSTDYVIMLLTPPKKNASKPASLGDIQRGKVDEFWKTMRAGCVLAYGDGYWFTFPHTRADAILQLVQNAQLGNTDIQSFPDGQPIDDMVRRLLEDVQKQELSSPK